MTAKTHDIPFSEYLTLPDHNSSSLKHMSKSPRHYKFHQLCGGKDTDALSFGRHIHTAILEPEKFESSFVEWLGAEAKNGEWTTDKRTVAGAWKKFKAAAAANGQEILDASQLESIELIRQAIEGSPEASHLLRSSQHEVTITWTHRFGCQMKMRADMLNSTQFLADLKSCRSAQPGDGYGQFGRDANDYGYHQQLAMYQDGAEALTGNRLPVYIVAVESSAPHDCVVYEVPEVALELGRSIYEENLARVLRCEKTDHWPGCGEGVQTLELPNWAYEENITARISLEGMEIEAA